MGRSKPPDDELGEFLWAKRRILGRSQEAIARSIPISTGTYARTEQGKTRPSENMLQQIGKALRLSGPEMMYVLKLAGHRASTPSLGELEVPPEPLLRLMRHQSPAPAYIVNHQLDILAFNSAASGVYGLDLENRPLQELNVLWLLFNCGELRDRLKDWHVHARRIVAQCRARSATAPRGGSIQRIMAELRRSSSEYRDFWGLAEAVSNIPVPKRVVHPHPRIGELLLDQSYLLYGDETGLAIIVSTAVDDSTRAKLDQLTVSAASGS